MIHKEQIKVILFDLDGTIYQDTIFHREYIRILTDTTPFASWTEKLIDFTDQVLEGKQLKMNHFYQDHELEFYDFEEYVTKLKALLVEGMPFETYYQGNTDNLYYLGDAWSVVTLIGKTLGIQASRGNHAFLSVREKMMTENLPKNMNLIHAVTALKEKYKTILLSNSPEGTAFDFVKKLGFEKAFTAMSFGSNKPLGLNEKLAQFAPEVITDPSILLSIGDHALNEIANVRMVGGQTIWMCPYSGIAEPEYDLKLKSLDDLAEYLKQLI